MSANKHFHFTSGQKIPRNPYSIIRKSTEKADFLQQHRYTTSDYEYFGRRVQTQNEDENNFEINKNIKKLCYNYLGNMKSSENMRMTDKDYRKYEQKIDQRKQKKYDIFNMQVPKVQMSIAAKNNYYNNPVFAEDKRKRESKVLLTQPGPEIVSKDKFVKKENKKLFERLLLTKDKTMMENLLKTQKHKQSKDQPLTGNLDSKQLKFAPQTDSKSKYQSIQPKQKLNIYMINDLNKHRQVMGQIDNLKRSGKVLYTQPCEASKPQIQILQKIGEGTFGQVYKAKMGGKVVAVKKVFQDKKYKNRQLEILNMIENNFVLRVLDTYHTQQKGIKKQPPKDYLNVVMEFYEQNLFDANCESQNPLSALEIKLFMYQLFRGLMYIHSISICHRDIKPQNLLVNRKDSRLVICDFGSAKKLIKGEENIAYICSRCYRAPQLIFGCTNYTPMIDIWSAGCVLLQLLTGEPFFIGDSNIGQLVEIIKVLGTPTKTEVMNMNPVYDLNDYKFPKIKTKSWRQVFPKIDQTLQSFLKQLMIYSPKERLNAAEALCHQYFDQLRQQQIFRSLKQKNSALALFQFTKQQLKGNEHLIDKLIPQWHQNPHQMSF